MTPDEREQMNYLCKRIESEQDPIAFDRLLRELNDLLEVKHSRIHPEQGAAPNNRSTAK
jgi:hypothetical protein